MIGSVLLLKSAYLGEFYLESSLTCTAISLSSFYLFLISSVTIRTEMYSPTYIKISRIWHIVRQINANKANPTSSLICIINRQKLDIKNSTSSTRKTIKNHTKKFLIRLRIASNSYEGLALSSILKAMHNSIQSHPIAKNENMKGSDI